MADASKKIKRSPRIKVAKPVARVEHVSVEPSTTTVPLDVGKGDEIVPKPNEHSDTWTFRSEIRRFTKKFAKHGFRLISEFLGFLVFISLSEILRFVLKILYHDPKFFDIIPVRYVIDFVEIVLILMLLKAALTEFNKDLDDD